MMQLLYIDWNPDPEIFPGLGISLRWYGILFAMGFVIGYFIVRNMFRREGYSIKMLDSLTTYMVIGTIVGARLGHCLFYEPDYYLSNPVEIFKIWQGGLASHGGALGILIALLLFSRKHKVGYLWILDRIAIPTALGGFFIRMGNLMNSEIFGIPTDLPWGFRFIRAYDPLLAVDPRHPTQIYEGLSYLLIFIFLMYQYYRRGQKHKDGYYLGVFMILVFTMRFLIEFLKEPQVDFETNMMLNLGQLLSIPFVLLGIYLLVRPRLTKK
jgi:prolipoprotein diacylglyceryl transferase